jgi:hypothetical protein
LSDFKLALFFSSLFKTELTRPAPCALAAFGAAKTATQSKAGNRTRETNLFIQTP